MERTVHAQIKSFLDNHDASRFFTAHDLRGRGLGRTDVGIKRVLAKMVRVGEAMHYPGKGFSTHRANLP